MSQPTGIVRLPGLGSTPFQRLGMKNLYLLSFGVVLATVFLANSAISATVEPGGYTNDFGIQPSAGDWATFSAAGQAQDNYEVDADVNANITAGSVTSQTTSNSAVPALQMGTATWSSSGFYLQTRPTGNRYTALMGKFVNNTGTNAT